MKERPILFSGAMVRALIDGGKTQTRRIVKARTWTTGKYFASGEYLTDLGYASSRGHLWAGFRHPDMESGSSSLFEQCPYGAPGDRLYVRETWSPDFAHYYPFDHAWYAADDDRRHEIDVRDGVRGIYSPESNVQVPFRWRPSIHMPRWASRITLEVTGVRVERLQAISASDSVSEGVAELPAQAGEVGAWWTADVSVGQELHARTAVDAYRVFWEHLNAARGYGWDVNPWVWVVEFKRIKP